jgi:hypothetical protein
MNQLNFIVVEEASMEFTGGEIESALEKGSQHHNFISVRSGDVFILSRLPLEDDTGGEKVILDKLEEHALVNSWRLEHFRVRGGHSEWAWVWSKLCEQEKARERRDWWWMNMLGFESEP